jgi:hypothetical protein
MSDKQEIEKLKKDVKSLEAVAVFGIMILVFTFGVLVGAIGLW